MGRKCIAGRAEAGGRIRIGVWAALPVALFTAGCPRSELPRTTGLGPSAEPPEAIDDGPPWIEVEAPAAPAPVSGEAPPSAFALSPSPTPELGVLGRRAAGYLVGERVVTPTEPYARGGEWLFTPLDGAAAWRVPSPLRVLPSGLVGVPAANLVSAGDALIGFTEGRALVIDGEGAVVPVGPESANTILGAAQSGGTIRVWWRTGGPETEIQALDAATGRSLWRVPGPAWSWSLQFDADAVRVVAGSGREAWVYDAADGRLAARVSLRALPRAWPGDPPVALAGDSLLVAADRGVARVDLVRGAVSWLAHGRAPVDAVQLAVDGDSAFAVFGSDLVAYDLASGRVDWVVGVVRAVRLRPVPGYLVLCDGDGGVSLLERSGGAVALRVGVGGCTDVRARADGTVVVAAEPETWLLGPAHTPPRDVVIEGTVTLDGAPAADLPLLLGVEGVPLDGLDGCPEMPPYASCVLSDSRGAFRTTVRGLGRVRVQVDLDAAARRAGRPRAEGGSAEVDLGAEVVAPLALAVVGAELEL